MAKFLTTTDIAAELRNLITEADKTLFLVSPYLQISPDFQELLTSREKKKKETIIIYGKNELTPDQLKFLTSLRYLYLKFYEKLHAKCYINDAKLIITSMNFYEYSMINNKEMGVIYDISDMADKEIYDKAFEYVKLIDDNSDAKPFELNINYNDKISAKDKTVDKANEKETIEIFESNKEGSSNVKFLSATKISKELGVSNKVVNSIFEKENWIEDSILTELGKSKGAQTKKSQYGEYIAWPESIIKDLKRLI